MNHIEAVVIGAGVVGLATARKLAQSGKEVVILESEKAIGTATSSRNSGVIHAGIYYNPGSLKARLCIKGRDGLYVYAAERGIPHRRCGKLVVATDDSQINSLHALAERGRQNGVAGLKALTRDEAKAIEPNVACTAAMLSPDTGIIDTHAYMLSLLGDAENDGATLVLNAPVVGVERMDDVFIVDVGVDPTERIACNILVNAAGLGAQAVAQSFKNFDRALVPPRVLAKGNYFTCPGKPPFSMHIYPLPVLGSSGLHATCDLNGRIRFGPDVEWVDSIDYKVDATRAAAFETAIKRYWPGLPADALQPDYCGIRPKIARASPHDTDFIVQSRRDHGLAGLINLFGIESPGLTSSLALADEVVSRLDADR